jgi:N-acetylneuraminate epimerase
MTLFILTLAFGFLWQAKDDWRELPAIPDREGFAGSFAGASHGNILVAGGANFPDEKPWDGGTKRWYGSVYQLVAGEVSWRRVGELPRPLGYGVSVSYQDKLICAGGSDATQHYGDVFSIEVANGQFSIASLPDMPHPLANGAGVLKGSTLFVVGGQESPTSTNGLQSVFSLDLSNPIRGWQAIEPFPGVGRILSVCSATEDSIFVFGGVELLDSGSGVIQRRYLRDCYQYRVGEGWTRLPDLPHALAAGATPAPVRNGKIFLVGGDDGTQVGIVHDQHKGFRRDVLQYDLATQRWENIGQTPAPRVTLTTVEIGEHFIFPSGEMKPGIRSPQVWSWNPAIR